MSIRSMRARVAAALRQARRARKTAAKPEAAAWRIETLEPKLLLSADALPGVQGLLSDPTADPVAPVVQPQDATPSAQMQVAAAASPLGTISSAPGNNLYLFGRGDGPTTVLSYSDPNLGKVNTLQFKAGVAPADVTVARATDGQAGADVALALTISGTPDVITFNGFLYGGTPANELNTLQQVKFSDGTVWDIPQLLFRLGMGSAGNDTQNGGSGADLLNGAAGNDALYGNGGADTLYGGAGDDALEGGDGNDILDGGSGNDTLNAGYGSNTFLFGRGDGQDRLYYNYNGGDASRINTLQFKAGVAPADVLVRQAYDNYFGGNNNALELSIVGTTDKVTVNAFFRSDDPANSYNGLQRVRFDDGTTWDLATLVAMSQVFTDGNDSVRGTNVADNFSGGLGNNSIGGAGGNDVIDGGPGNDTLSGDEGDDTLIGNTGNDTLYGGNGTDTLQGDDGNDYLQGDGGIDTLTGGAGDDTLEGGDGNDVLDGGSGNDTLNAGYGSNTFLFGRGDGQDRLYYNYNGGDASRVNTLQFKAGVAPDRKSTRLNSSHNPASRMPSSA
jgi:Ca2+-binding RTX toxin-like protein